MKEFKKPLADLLRPTKLNEVLGQEHLTAPGKLLNQLTNKKQLISIILWGPPGSGKTTLSRIISSNWETDFVEMSAVTSGKKDIIRIIDQARLNKEKEISTVLFMDEIHRFNKAQQDAFLPFIENGTLTLIGATTENPSFEIIPSLLSRCRVLILNELTNNDISKILNNASLYLNLTNKLFSQEAMNHIALLSGGDARNALNILEICYKISSSKPITKKTVELAALKQIPYHDKKGENHYNLISALIKSIRGSDQNASFYYLARMLQAGEDPKFIARRLIIFASEDIGIAAPAALNIAVSTFQAVERLGLPECSYALFECVLVLVKSPKSRLVASAMYKAQSKANNTRNLPVPLHIRNAPTKFMKDLGYLKDYQWKPDYKPKNGFLPSELKDENFFN